jgi:hypothetical protein
MPDRSKVMTQTKRDNLVLQVGGWAWGKQPHPIKNVLLRSLYNFKLDTILEEAKVHQGL